MPKALAINTAAADVPPGHYRLQFYLPVDGYYDIVFGPDLVVR